MPSRPYCILAIDGLSGPPRVPGLGTGFASGSAEELECGQLGGFVQVASGLDDNLHG